MKLYYSPYSCSLAPHIVLRELGLPFAAVKVELGSGRLPDGSDYAAINPKGYVPALELEDGQVLTEVAALLQYLGDLGPGLLAAHETMGRYRTIEWLTFIGTELHKGFGPLFDPAMPEAARARAREKLARRLAWLDEHLAGREHLQGEAFTVADAYAFTVLNWAKGVDMDLARWPDLRAYFRRVKDRPAVREALRAQREAQAA